MDILEYVPLVASILAVGLTWLGLREKRADISHKVNSLCTEMMATIKRDNDELRIIIDVLEEKITRYRSEIEKQREEILEQHKAIESLLRDKAESERKLTSLEKNIIILKDNSNIALRRIEILTDSESWRLRYIQYLLQGIRMLVQQIIANNDSIPAFAPISLDQFMLDNAE